MMKQQVTCGMLMALSFAVVNNSQAQDLNQTEAEFQKLMPVTGSVETFFGDFQLDHSFPAPGEADRIYDLMDHQRASQLYLWGLPLVA